MPTYSISGNAGIASALVVLGGTATSTTTAAGDGSYSFTGLSNGNYFVICQLAGKVFSPYYRYFTLYSANITGVNFTAASIATPLGVWAKQGIISSGFGVSGSGYAAEPSVIYEGNAQILSGNVFKMWYNGGPNPAFCIYYAESLTGLPGSWTNYSGNPVISQHNGPRVFKYEGTYHMYPNTNNWGYFDHYTSPNGVAWTLANTNVLATGSASGNGTWDSGQVYNMQIVQVDGNGTWWAVYGGNGTGNIQGTGLATSPDGASWTKYTLNPVITNFTSINVVTVNGVWYAWGDVTVYGAGGAYPYQFPTNFGRTSSLDLMNWTPPIPSMQATLPWETAGNGNYQIDSPAVLQVGSQVYMWYDGSPIANTGDGFQIGLAIANCTLAQLVQIGNESDTGSYSPYTFPSYQISGSAGIANALVSYSGAANGIVYADGSGNYLIPGLPNGNYTLSVALPGYVFAPSTKSVTISGANVTSTFTGIVATSITPDNSTDLGVTSGTSLTHAHTTSGTNRILFVGFYGDTPAGGHDDITGVTYSGVAMSLVAKSTASTIHNFSYLYVLENPSLGTHNVVISCTNSHALSGGAISYNGVAQTGQPETSNAVSTGSDDTQWKPWVGASFVSQLPSITNFDWQVLLEQNYYASAAPIALVNCIRRIYDGTYGAWSLFDSNGPIPLVGTLPFQIGTNRNSGESAADLHITASFSPASTSYIYIAGNAGIGGATVSYSGQASGSVTADSDGSYTLPGLANGSYTITPSKTGYAFSPASANETVSGADITGVNFTATQASNGGAWFLLDQVSFLEDIPRRRGH